jgi:[acyl-carrier-protein] S-malonyltransferase
LTKVSRHIGGCVANAQYRERMDRSQLQQSITHAAFGFRGYNTTNLGRTPELLAHPRFSAIVERRLSEASAICTTCLDRPVDLVARVEQREETTLQTYGEAVGLIVAVELAQLEILETCFEIPYAKARLGFGFSLGEVTALIAGKSVEMAEALRPPLLLSGDCAALAEDVTLGVLFSRGPQLPIDDVVRLCLHITNEGQGVIAPSAYLAPNSLLLMGQGATLDRFKQRIPDAFPDRVYLRKNEDRWPPLHTPIMWEKAIPNRSAVLMHSMRGAFVAPQPPVLSLVTGKASYNDFNIRETLHRWVDHPQRLWEVVLEILSQDIEVIVHVGPDPNIVPATFSRLSENVAAQIKARLGVRAVSEMVARPWLKSVLPARSALLRAPLIRHVVLEDWLLANAHN